MSAIPDPRCACGQPVAVSWRECRGWGVGPWTHTCLACAPARVVCADWVRFTDAGRDAEARTGGAS